MRGAEGRDAAACRLAVPSITAGPLSVFDAVLHPPLQVYKVLEATPRDGAKFCRAVREVLAREVTWVLWKKGGKDFGEHGYNCSRISALRLMQVLLGVVEAGRQGLWCAGLLRC